MSLQDPLDYKGSLKEAMDRLPTIVRATTQRFAGAFVHTGKIAFFNCSPKGPPWL